MAGNYPPPPPPQGPGNYPPPPPPPQGPGGYGPPPRPGSFDVGAAFSWAWDRFKQNAGPLVLGVLVIVVVSGIINTLTSLPTIGAAPDSSATAEDIWAYAGANAGWGIVGGIVSAVLVAPLTLNLARMALGIADGRQADVGDMFKFDLAGPAIVLGLLTYLLTMVGLVLCVIPGLIFAFGAGFSTLILADTGRSPWESIKASFGVYKVNLGMALVAVLLGGLVAAVGVIACVIGVLVTAPIGLLFVTYAYRSITGGRVAV